MAESRSAKAKRWLRRDFTKSELQGMVAALVADKVIDVATGGKLNALTKKAMKRVVLPLMKRGTTAAGTTAGRLAITAARGVKTIAMRHPVLTAGAVTYYAYKNREEIGDLVEQGYEILSPVGQGLQERLPLPQFDRPELPAMPSFRGLTIRKKRPSSFNKAVAKGMSVIKKSTSFGKKGVINNPKKAFATVTKVAAAVKKRKKSPVKGIRRKLYSAMKRFFK